jgi:hypothetical protein
MSNDKTHLFAHTPASSQIKLDPSLTDDAWHQAVEVLYTLMLRNSRYRDVTITLRAMGESDWQSLAKTTQDLESGSGALDDAGNDFEFVFDVNGPAFILPSGDHAGLVEWVEAMILRRVDRYLETRSGGEPD